MKLESTEAIVDLYRRLGGEKYSEAISQTEHAVQCAWLAEEEGAESHLVLAALLHDIGHLVDLETHGGQLVLNHDTRHEATGGNCLSSIYPARVRNPIVLHVEAKRWLCARRAGYMDGLSPASVHSLGLQGGPMSGPEADRFESMPGFADAVALRLWDDLGKDGTRGGGIDDFENLLLRHSAAVTAG
jgi:predicted HD phosphohydrolase